VSPGKKKGEKIVTAVHDFVGYQTYVERQGHNFIINEDFDGVRVEDYDALLLPGGRAPEYLRLNERVLELVKHFFDREKPIAAICHGPQILAAAGVLRGRRLTAYPALKPEVLAAGGRWEEPGEDLANVVIDGNLVTAPAWGAHPQWVKAFVELLVARIET
jgi:protease I